MLTTCSGSVVDVPPRFIWLSRPRCLRMGRVEQVLLHGSCLCVSFGYWYHRLIQKLCCISFDRVRLTSCGGSRHERRSGYDGSLKLCRSLAIALLEVLPLHRWDSHDPNGRDSHCLNRMQSHHKHGIRVECPVHVAIP